MVAFVSDQRHQNELKLCLTLLYLSLSTELYVYLPYSAHTKASSFDRSAALTSSVVPSLAKTSITDWSFFRVFSGLNFLFPAKQLVVSEPVKALRPRIASLKLEDIDNSYSKLPAGRTISGVFFKNRHFSPIASVFLCGVFVLYCISLKLSESTVFNHVFLISFESKGRR